MAVQAKREISRLWDDITKSPYKTLFNASVSGPFLWERVQALRSIEAALQMATKKYAGRDALICIHGNRFIEWAAMHALSLKPGDKFSAAAGNVQQIVDRTVSNVTSAVRAGFPDSYPASLFKNLTKCRALAVAIQPPNTSNRESLLNKAQ
jgi:hypothetical protein